MTTGERDDHWKTWVGPDLAGLRKPQLAQIYHDMRTRGFGGEIESATVKTLKQAIEAGRQDYWATKQRAQPTGVARPRCAAGTLPNSRDQKQRSPIPAARDRISAREVNEMLRGFPEPHFS